MKKKTKSESFIREPKYPGGKKALDEFIRFNMRYPEEAVKQRIEGSVTIQYDIDVFGAVVDAKVIHGIGHGCDEEAIRLVKLLQYEKKKYRGLRVTFHQTIHIHFHLPGSIPKPEQKEMKINYQYIEKKNPAKTDMKISYKIIPGK
jgi:protein TonB